MKIAILDSHFDLDEPLLDGAQADSRTHSTSAGHGTAVALIASMVAPEATILLKDVSVAGILDGYRVRDALRDSRSESVDIVCMSFGQEFAWEPFREEQLPIVRVLHGQDDLDVLRQILRDWTRGGSFKGHAKGGCEGFGVFCEELEQSSASSPLLIAAAGNSQDWLACPGIHSSVVSVGFHKRELEVIDNSRFIGSTDVLPLGHSLFADVTVDLVPGFAGTSFAAPLLAGFAALTDSPSEIRRGVQAHQATSLVRERHMTLCRPPMLLTKGEDPFETTRGLYEACNEFFEDVHVHHESPKPCVLCSLYYDEFWQMKGLLYYGAQEFSAALRVLEFGVKLTPTAAELLRNLAATLWALGMDEGRQSLRADLLFRAAATWRKAAGLSLNPAALASNADAAFNEAVQAVREVR